MGNRGRNRCAAYCTRSHCSSSIIRIAQFTHFAWIIRTTRAAYTADCTDLIANLYTNHNYSHRDWLDNSR
jgi:hypothetical protein